MAIFFILGSDSAEMQAVEALLSSSGIPYAHALAGGRRGWHGEADALSAPVPANRTVYAVGCTGPAIPMGAITVARRGADLPGSLIGQVLAILASCQGSENGPMGQWAGARLSAQPQAGALVHEGGSWHVAVAGVRREGTKGTYGGLYARWVRVPDDIALIPTIAAVHAAPIVEFPADPDCPTCRGDGGSGYLRDSDGSEEPCTCACYEATDMRGGGLSVAEIIAAAANTGYPLITEGDGDGCVTIVTRRANGWDEDTIAAARRWAVASGMTLHVVEATT